MTELASEVPAPRPEAEAVAGAAEQSTLDNVREKAGEAAERVGDALGRAGDAVNDAVERASSATGQLASQVAGRIRNNATLPAERGRTTIADEVVEKIAGMAAREVPGVYDLGGDVARIFSAVKERIGLGDAGADSDRGVRVELDGPTAVIHITIVIEFGFQVFSVTDKVREKVISSVENLLGLEVIEVNVSVDDVHMQESGPIGNDAERAVGYSSATEAIRVG